MLAIEDATGGVAKLDDDVDGKLPTEVFDEEPDEVGVDLFIGVIDDDDDDVAGVIKLAGLSVK